MIDLRQAATLALDALTYIYTDTTADEDELIDQAITALRTALEQQAEPVAWMFQHDETGRISYVSNDGMHTPDLFLKTNLRYALVCPLYTTSPQQQAEPPPEWPLIKNILDEYGLQAISFVADWKAAQRPWVGLTEFQFAEIYNKWNDTNGSTPWGLNQALEAKLKERNK